MHRQAQVSHPRTPLCTDRHRSHTHGHHCCEFLIAVVMLCTKECVANLPSPSPCSHIPSTLSSTMFPGHHSTCYRCSIQGRAPSSLKSQHSDHNKGNRKYGRFSLAKPPLTCRDYSPGQNLSLSLLSAFVSLILHPSLRSHSEHSI